MRSMTWEKPILFLRLNCPHCLQRSFQTVGAFLFLSTYFHIIRRFLWNFSQLLFRPCLQQSAGVIDANASIDISSALTTITTELEAKSLGELFALMLETWVVSFAMTVMGALITIILYGRMIEIYIYASVGLLPFATLANHEWGNIGTNYIRGLTALGLQGFLNMVITGIYAVLVKTCPYPAATCTELSGLVWPIPCCSASACLNRAAYQKVF